MNLMDSAIDVIDGRVCTHDAQIQTLQGYETRAAQSAAEALQSAQDSEDSATEASGYVDDCNTLANLCSQHYQNAKAEAQNSEAWAVGTRNGTAVPSTDETYENNSKYYAEQAQQIVDYFTINNETPTFTQASTRANINSGEAISTIMGKIKKFFADLKTVAFTGNASDVSFDNTGTTSSATTVQAGLVEALTNSAPTASDVPYTNTTSGLSATNVQGAIDEVVATKQIANGVVSSWSSALALNTSYTRILYGSSTNYNGGVAITSLLKGKPYKLTITGTCSNVTNNIDVVVALKTANATSSVDADMVACAIGSTKISGTSFTVETELLIPKTVSPTYCEYWIKKSSSSTTVTINNIHAKWEEIGVYDALKIGDDNIQNRISNVETKGLSSQAYSTGQYFTHGDKLKKVTSAIASGDTISSSNTEDTTVGAELTEINSNLSAKCPLWTTVATVSSVSASGTTVNLPFLTTSGKRLRVIAYSSMWYVEMTSYGATSVEVNRSGSNGLANSTDTRGFMFTWVDGNAQTCTLKYYQNRQLTAFNAEAKIQVCKDYV